MAHQPRFRKRAPAAPILLFVVAVSGDGGRRRVENRRADGYHTESRSLTLRYGRSEAMTDLLWEEKDGVLIARLVVSGPISDEDIDSIGQELMKSPKRSAGKILLNLQDIEFIYSALLGKLVALRRQCKQNKTDLKLCSIRPVIMDVMKVARFDEIFEIYSSEQKTITTF